MKEVLDLRCSMLAEVYEWSREELLVVHGQYGGTGR